MIKFQCPSGHPLSAPENLAGRSGKCPKCSSSFIIPRPDEAESDGGNVAASGSTVTPAMGSGSNLASKDEIFVFLCPNGHKLNGPPSLKGRPGQCPHCGARFLIPTDEDLEFEEETSSGEDDEGAEDDGQRVIEFERRAGNQNRHPLQPPAGAAGLGFIFAQLWNRRPERSELEVFLNEGEIIVPDFFAEALSTSDYAVFGLLESDGSHSITVIPWSNVRRVAFRRLEELPGELFQE
jgi:hypothetical protein